LVPLYVFLKNFSKIWAKNKGDQGNFFEFFKNYFNTLFFAEKHSFLSEKRSEFSIFDENFVEILESMQKPEFFVEKCLLYDESAQEMKNFWFKKCQIWGFFAEKWKNLDNFGEKL
jgi:hypothetical protein